MPLRADVASCVLNVVVVVSSSRRAAEGGRREAAVTVGYSSIDP
jgi:hypothetical protein